MAAAFTITVFCFIASQRTDVFPPVHNLWVLSLLLVDPHFGVTHHMERALLRHVSSVNITFAHHELLETPFLFQLKYE